MIIIGVSILGNLNKQATSEGSLGTTFWRLVIASGIIVSILGVANIFAVSCLQQDLSTVRLRSLTAIQSYMFRQKSLGITARQVRDHGAVAPQKVYVSPSPSKSNGRRSLHLGRSDTLPSYYTKNHSTYEQEPIRNISAPIAAKPQFDKSKRNSSAPPVLNGVQRPDLAFHPAMQGQAF